MATAREASRQNKISAKTYRIGELCALSGLSRSTLLYYDSIGLLFPSGRASNNYRVYTERDVARLGRIRAFRDAGVSLAEIRDMLDSNRPGPAKETLEARLREIGEAIGRLRLQRELVLRLLKTDRSSVSDVGIFREVLSRIDMSAGQKAALHREFEALSPDGHESFLRFIGFGEKEIAGIKKKSKRKN